MTQKRGASLIIIVDDLRDDVVRVARSCERAARSFEKEVAFLSERLQVEIEAAQRAWSGSWIGYHARVYIEDLQPRDPDESWDSEWPPDSYSSTTRGRWKICDEDGVKAEILRRAGIAERDLAAGQEAATRVGAVFDDARAELLSSLDAVLATSDDRTLRRERDEVDGLKSHFFERDFIQDARPTQVITRDRAAHAEGLRAPPHFQLEARRLSLLSYGLNIVTLGKHARYVEKYLEKRLKMAGKSIARTDGKIFIGHGGSVVWRDLKDFIQDRLKLPWDEFNREPTAGMSTKERLEDMLDASSFAFLVMTAEDEHADGSRHARANVIHEVGLFQGRLGFERAIILLEDGCEEFSNIKGITEIRFPKGNVSAKFEDVRKVLEREKILR